jgi:hypothetical protein
MGAPEVTATVAPAEAAPADVALAVVATVEVAPAEVAPTARAAVWSGASSPSSRPETTGVPLGPSSCGKVGATATGVAAGGASPPAGGNLSPLRLPAPDLAESSFRLCLVETRSSAPAKSRAPEALAGACADAAVLFELSCGGACWGTATTGMRMVGMTAFMVLGTSKRRAKRRCYPSRSQPLRAFR